MRFKIYYLKDGRYFIAHASPEIYNKLLEFSYEKDSLNIVKAEKK